MSDLRECDGGFRIMVISFGGGMAAANDYSDSDLEVIADNVTTVN